MQILIMRHGDAVVEASSDKVRPLTASGYQDSVCMAAWMQAQAFKIDLVLVSPYLRAQQTLTALTDAFTLPESVETVFELVPGGSAAKVSHHLTTVAQQGIGCVLLISHLPLVGYLVSELCPGESPPMFATSALASVLLDAQGGRGILEWQIGPEQVIVRAS